MNLEVRVSLTCDYSDIDNCLYLRSTNVADLVRDLISQYVVNRLNVPFDDAVGLRNKYYTKYGLAIGGLVRHQQVDPRDYSAKVDDALPQADVIKPNPEMLRLLEDIDKSKEKMPFFTNAYVTHSRRVIKPLGIENLFDGLTFCDYSEQPLVCKPHPDRLKKGMRGRA